MIFITKIQKIYYLYFSFLFHLKIRKNPTESLSKSKKKTSENPISLAHISRTVNRCRPNRRKPPCQHFPLNFQRFLTEGLPLKITIPTPQLAPFPQQGGQPVRRVAGNASGVRVASLYGGGAIEPVPPRYANNRSVRQLIQTAPARQADDVSASAMLVFRTVGLQIFYAKWKSVSDWCFGRIITAKYIFFLHMDSVIKSI